MQGTASAARPALQGMSPAGLVALVAVLAVLVVVSLPRLHGMAVAENQGDARATTELIARALVELAPEEQGASLEELAGRTRLARSLRDAEWLEGGRVLRLHGYLFELCPLAPEPPPFDEKLALSTADTGAQRRAVRAWPWSPSTGRTVFLADGQGGMWSHANDSGAWHGLAARPDPHQVEQGRGWRVLP